MLKFYINNNGGANKNNNNEIIRSNNSNRNKNKLQTKHNKNYVGIKLMRFAVSLRNETLVSFCDPLGYFHIQTYLLTLLPTPNTFSNLFTNLSIYLTGRCLLWMETSVIGDRWARSPLYPFIDHLLHTWWRVNYCEAFAIDFAWFIGPRVRIRNL